MKVRRPDYLFVIACIGVAVLFCLMAFGCVAGPKGSTISIAAGTASGRLTDALADLTAAKPHSDPTGVAYISSAAGSIGGVLHEQLPILEAAGPELDKAKQALATEHSRNRWFGWETRAIGWTIVTVLSILLAIHLIAGAVAMFAPPPYSTIAGTIAKIVNPLGWFTWLVSHVQHRARLKAASDSITLLR